ncbi:hypothetical protein [Minwuia sp.]|uniref:hypothetical protein n=1 Tax=Minwuia sp. TaxID=2493630 RepID=UPI003A95B3C5
MMTIIPYLPGLFAQQSPMAGYAYLSGTIILAERCDDQDPTAGPGCPAHLSTMEIVVDRDAPLEPDMIPIAGAIGQLQTFEKAMKERHGAFQYLLCTVPFAQCVADRG